LATAWQAQVPAPPCLLKNISPSLKHSSSALKTPSALYDDYAFLLF